MMIMRFLCLILLATHNTQTMRTADVAARIINMTRLLVDDDAVLLLAKTRLGNPVDDEGESETSEINRQDNMSGILKERNVHKRKSVYLKRKNGFSQNNV